MREALNSELCEEKNLRKVVGLFFNFLATPVKVENILS